MRSRHPATLVGVALALWVAASSLPAGAQELRGKELRKALRQAEKAFDSDRYGAALELYDRILASTSGQDERRADALYASALIRFSPDAELRDVERGRQHLEELAAFPRHPRRVEIAIMGSLLERLDDTRAEVRGRIAEMETKIAAFEAEREQAEAERQEAAGESEAAGDRVRSVESRLRRARAELAGCQAELEAKEEALQKLRDALVGGS